MVQRIRNHDPGKINGGVDRRRPQGTHGHLCHLLRRFGAPRRIHDEKGATLPAILRRGKQHWRIGYSGNCQQVKNVHLIEYPKTPFYLGEGEVLRDPHDPGIGAAIEKKLLHRVAEVEIERETAKLLFEFAEIADAYRAVACPTNR
jgi:hypothetical protein